MEQGHLIPGLLSVLWIAAVDQDSAEDLHAECICLLRSAFDSLRAADWLQTADIGMAVCRIAYVCLPMSHCRRGQSVAYAESLHSFGPEHRAVGQSHLVRTAWLADYCGVSR